MTHDQTSMADQDPTLDSKLGIESWAFMGQLGWDIGNSPCQPS